MGWAGFVRFRRWGCRGKMGSLKARNRPTKTLPEKLERRIRFGEVRPIIHADFAGKKFVAVGNQVYWGDWKVFPDFLRHYLPSVLNPEWCRTEASKEIENRHPIMVWQDKMHRFL